MGQIDEFRSIRAQFITQRLAEGDSMKQAEAESKEIETVYKRVNSKLQKFETSRQKLEQAIKKHEKTLKTHQREKSNKVLSLKLAISQNSLQEVQMALLEYKHELEPAKLAVQDKSLFQNCSAVSKKYLVEVGAEFCKFADFAIGVMNTVGYVVGELVIPSGLAGVEAYDKGATVGDAVKTQKKAIGDELAVVQAFGAGGAVGYIGYKLNKLQSSSSNAGSKT